LERLKCGIQILFSFLDCTFWWEYWLDLLTT
jgi:hypothetical protein